MAEGKILGIDFGERRIGVAISDALKITAQVLPTIKVKFPQQAIIKLKNIISEKNISEIVVGMPYNLKGEKGNTAQKVEVFIEQLKNNFQLPIHIWDERLTSVAAERTIVEFGKSPSRNKEKIDQIAALFILQAFLDRISLTKKNELNSK